MDTRKTVGGLVLLCLLIGWPLPGSTLDIGEPAPPIALPTLPTLPAGEEVRLSNLKGKVVYLDFWASWCGPCRISLPALERIYRDLKEQGLEVLAVGVDEHKRDALAFLKDFPVSYPVVWDSSGDTPSRYQVPGMPTAFLIDRNGIVREVHIGFRKSDAEALRAKIVELLDE
ncbi:MAG: TlpA family protein disulfide reductase [Halieaceae bacterium]|nr:TlpA family protein disulfide reductase [Halieaceae bacterium]